MREDRVREVRRRLDENLSIDAFRRERRSTEAAATRFFQDLFVEVLDFEEPSTRGDETWRDLPVDEWGEETPATAARLVAEAGAFRVVYVELEEAIRVAERHAVQALVSADGQGGWTRRGTFLAVFHAPGADTWDLVTPYETGTEDLGTVRPVLRRFVLGAGATHRTVARSLGDVDGTESQFADRVDDAFRVDRVTEAFHGTYEDVFATLGDELRADGLGTRAADRYAHLTLTRLLVCHYLQAAGWMGERTDFVRWFHQQYEESGDAGRFHDTWLSALFFDGLNRPAGTAPDADLPDEVADAIADLPPVDGGLFEPCNLDETDVSLSDDALHGAVRGFLERYDVTATEATPYDVDVAVDPSMLGTLYESLATGRDGAEAGTVYTPRTEVDLICRLALYEQFRDEYDDPDADVDRRIVDFVFADPHECAPVDEVDAERFEAVLRDLRVVDPACGSGAFLVGMKRVVVELYRKLGWTPDYDLAAQIVSDNLYGVDVADWAVRVAEFRLWLSAVQGDEPHPGDRPGPPAGSSNLYVGDSLVPEMVGDDLAPEVDDAESSSTDEDGSAEGSDPRFVPERDCPEVMRNGGFDVVVGNPPYVRQEDIVGRGSGPARSGATSADAASDRRSGYKRRLREFVARRFDVEPYETSDLYLYFYVRGIDLLRDGGTLSFVTPNAWLDVDYGVRLQELLLANGEIEYLVENRTRRSFVDAAVNTAIAVVNRGSPDRLSGETTFVSTDVPYRRLDAVEVLSSASMDGDPETGVEAETLDFEDERVRVRTADSWRAITLSAGALWRLGGGTTLPTEDGAGVLPRGRYRSGKWGTFTRAPTVFFEMAGNASRPLSRLGDECELRRGTRTGANQFFYLPSTYYDARSDGESLVLTSTGEWPDAEYESELRIPREYWMHRTEHGWEPNLVVKTSRSFETTTFGLDSLELGDGLRYVFVADEPKSDLPRDARAYVEWGETYDPSRDDLGRKTTPFPSSVSSRGVAWYDVSDDLRRGDVLPMKNVHTRHAYWVPERRTWIDDRLHAIEVPGDETDRKFLAGLLNSTYGTLSCEVNGRANLGQGALDLATADHERTLVPPLDGVDDELKAAVAAQFDSFGRRRVTSIFDDLGAEEPDVVSFDTVATDRLELDRLVVGELLGFDEATLQRLYEATLRVVERRISKAESV